MIQNSIINVLERGEGHDGLKEDAKNNSVSAKTFCQAAKKPQERLDNKETGSKKENMSMVGEPSVTVPIVPGPSFANDKIPYSKTRCFSQRATGDFSSDAGY